MADGARLGLAARDALRGAVRLTTRDDWSPEAREAAAKARHHLQYAQPGVKGMQKQIEIEARSPQEATSKGKKLLSGNGWRLQRHHEITPEGKKIVHK